MQYPEFIHAAKRQFNVTTETEALTISRAFLHTLTGHLAGNTADNLGAQLPAQLLQIIREIGAEDRDQGQRFKLTEFYNRVADRAGVDPETGKRYTHQFVQLLSQMVTAAELQKIAGTLSDDYAPLFETVNSA